MADKTADKPTEGQDRQLAAIGCLFQLSYNCVHGRLPTLSAFIIYEVRHHSKLGDLCNPKKC
jgi:hypothetical protein